MNCMTCKKHIDPKQGAVCIECWAEQEVEKDEAKSKVRALIESSGEKEGERTAENCGHANPFDGCDVAHGDCAPSSCPDWKPAPSPGPLPKRSVYLSGLQDSTAGYEKFRNLDKTKLIVIEPPAPLPAEGTVGPTPHEQAWGYATSPIPEATATATAALPKEVEEAMDTARKAIESLPTNSLCVTLRDMGLDALAVIRPIIDDYERLRAEVREWKRIALKTRPPLR